MSSLAVVPASNLGVQNSIAVALPPAPAPTLAQDLNEIMLMVNFKQIEKLMNRYLLNDAEFQTFVRIINSRDAYLTFMRFRTQPEVIAFVPWVQTQIRATRGKFKWAKFKNEMSLFNESPFWANTVFGWQGFISEFMLYHPTDMISAHVNMKVAENGIFAQFWQRLTALKPVYDRVVASPEAQRLAATLQLNGIDVNQLDTLVRNQFGWQVPLVNSTGIEGGALY
ncbi:uncharacterized protein LOC106082509 [Stomoxys calcitrans]|uniref:uncharacterized protein LOC106082509 n=1 Tax=Stomoxys calcitrans TaxID=35570 RepID=UPI0027E34360|nr:uncharacterized protein LOC106082509 [Stomoxys calcitrans]